MDRVKISVQCFGAFREFGDSLLVDVKKKSSVLQVKEALVQNLGERHRTLVEESVLANNKDILPNDYVLRAEEELSILPPVCGG